MKKTHKDKHRHTRKIPRKHKLGIEYGRKLAMAMRKICDKRKFDAQLGPDFAQ